MVKGNRQMDGWMEGIDKLMDGWIKGIDKWMDG